MAATTFSNGTVIQPAWLNDVDDLVYRGALFASNSTYAPAGDGVTDDTTILTSLLNAAASSGAVVYLERNATYAVTSLTIPSGTKMFTNGASFVDLNGTTGNTAFITISDDVVIDRLAITIPSGKQRDRVINATGDRWRIDWLKVTAASQQANNTDTADVAVRLNNCDDWYVGLLEVSGYDRAINAEGCLRWRIGGLIVNSYVRGVYLVNNQEFFIGKSYVGTAAPNSSTAAGCNGLLMGCDSDYQQRNGTVEDMTIEDAGEHAVRVGGPYSHRGIYLVRFRISNCGRCGIKVLGTDTGAPTEYNEGIWIIEPFIEDAGDGVGAAENCVGVMFEFVKFGRIISPTIRARNKTYSCSFGIRLNGCEDCDIVSPIISKPHYDGVLFHAENGDLTRITLDGGEVNDAGRHGMSFFVADGKTARRVKVTSFVIDTVASYGLTTSLTGTGTLVDCFAEVHMYNIGTGNVQNTSTALSIHGWGVGAPTSTAADGSMWHATGGDIYKRDTGAWVAL